MTKTLSLTTLLWLLFQLSECAIRFDYTAFPSIGGWLKYHEVPTTWNEARLRCHAEGAILASPLSQELQNTIIDFVHQRRKTMHIHTNSPIYVGVHALFADTDYSSIEGVPLARLSVTWAANEPNNYRNSEHCLQMEIRPEIAGAMADVVCNKVLPYVCFKKIVNDAQTFWGECGTDDIDYTLNNETGSCYKFHQLAQSWTEAYKICTAEGGYLAVPNTDIELKAMNTTFAKWGWPNVRGTRSDRMHIGFHDWGSYTHRFMTIHGDDIWQHWWQISRQNGTSLRPGDSGQYCGTLTKQGRLSDSFCQLSFPFLCEKDPQSLYSDISDLTK